MRKNVEKAINSYRIRRGPLTSEPDDGVNGAFFIPLKSGSMATVVASDGGGWEHVSVSFKMRCPTWGEMDEVKRIFWRDDECVMQLHVPRSSHVSLWFKPSLFDATNRHPN